MQKQLNVLYTEITINLVFGEIRIGKIEETIKETDLLKEENRYSIQKSGNGLKLTQQPEKSSV